MTANHHDPEIAQLEAMQALIAEQRQDDPLIGCKVGSELALQWLIERLATERGVHAETLMAVVGILMGQSSQASLWAEALEEGHSGVLGLHLVRCQDDSCYYVGEALNQRLMEGFDSPWSLLREGARQEGCERVPDGEQLLLEGIQRLCSPAFGKPQVPAIHAPEDLSTHEQQQLWLLIQPLCLGFCASPGEWPVLCGLLGVRALRLVRPHLDPALALRLAMDAAIDAAKVPLAGGNLG